MIKSKLNLSKEKISKARELAGTIIEPIQKVINTQ